MIRFLSRRQRELDLDDEIRVHLEMAIRERVARGEPKDEAEVAAFREFGDVRRINIPLFAGLEPGSGRARVGVVSDRVSGQVTQEGTGRLIRTPLLLRNRRTLNTSHTGV